MAQSNTNFDNSLNASRDSREADESRTRSQADLVGVHYLDSRGVIEKLPLARGIISIKEMRKLKVAPLSRVDRQIVFAIMPQTSQKVQSMLRSKLKDYVVQYVMISDSGMRDLMLRFDPPKKVEYRDVDLSGSETSRGDIMADISSTLEKVPGNDIFDYLMDQVGKLGASDIHLETLESGSLIRMRIDGVLHSVAKISEAKTKQLMTTLARTANIGIASPDPQTGHIIYTHPRSHQQVNMRIETIMTIHGQDTVMRVLTSNEDLLQLTDLGHSQKNVDLIDGVLQNPHGLMMVTGPTGSGKTTTLYSILRRIDTKTHKVITLEDPVESEIKGIVQIPVDTQNDQTFAQLLRSVMRLDPDVILIGEIRDNDTARTALQAALTGHLVLSSFHANSAAGALARMREMVGANPLFASAFKMVLAQRLVRFLPEDGRQVAPDDYQYKEAVLQYIGRDLTDGEELYVPNPTEDLPFGYKGRIPIAEVLPVKGEIAKSLSSKVMPSTSDLHDMAIASGMKDLKAVGIEAALRGDTTIDEIMRVVDW